jgi:hypothetical protein
MTDATWKPTPINGDFNNNGNWVSDVVPDGTAFFAASSITSLNFSAVTTIGGWTFSATAPSFSFEIAGLTFTGAGIVSAGAAPNLNLLDGSLKFQNFSSAGNAEIISNNDIPGFGVLFFDHSNAAVATITNNQGTRFYNFATAGDAVITNNHQLEFHNSSTAGNAVVTTAFGGTTAFLDSSDGGTAQFVTVADATVDFSQSLGPGNDGFIHAGSIDGAGTYHLGANVLIVGANNLSTTVSGVIDGSGSLVKEGTGTLTLSHAGNGFLGIALHDGTLGVAAPGAAGGEIDMHQLFFPPSASTALTIENSALSGHVFGTPVADLLSADVIDLPGLPFSMGAAASLNTSTNNISVTSGGVTDTLTLKADSGTFVAYFDGDGGTAVGLAKLLRTKSVVVSVAETPGQDSDRHGRERRAQANRCRSVESGLGDVKTGG